ncbi:MAG: hypothetical protein COA79_20620 [Planctomycetota bacterium]|nr:MAG: hypothetical protein COA79_20620 [Planctomycetota bacterium]
MDTSSFLKKIDSLQSHTDENIFVIAHRGGYKNDWELKTPENSLKNVEKAIDLNYDMIEMDVCRSIDGHFVLMHDSKLDKRTSGSGHTYEKTWTEMSTFKLNYSNGVESELFMTSFVEVLKLIKDRMLIKLHRKFPIEFLPDFFQLIDDYNVKDHILFWEDWEPGEKEHIEREALFASNPNFRTFNYLMTVKNVIDLAPIFDSCHIVAIELPFLDIKDEVISKDNIQEIKNRGVRLSANVQNKPDRVAGLNDGISLENPAQGWGKILDFGFSMIQTDYPELLRKYIISRNTL